MTGMTDKQVTAGQNGRAALSALAAVAALVLLAGVALTVRGSDPAREPTFVSQPRAVTLTLVDGQTSTPTGRTRVPAGATVRTAPGGSAVLTTADREVLLGSDTAVTVVDGERQRLGQGLVMVDARRADALALEAGAGTVTSPRGAVIRVERGLLLRVASFRGDAEVQAAGRKASSTVTALHQVQVPYGGLPGRVTALALTRDGWERRFAQGLVSRDVDLNGLAAGLAADDRARSAVAVPAAFLTGDPVGAGELALSFLVARATGQDEQKVFAQVRSLRDEGGSWGVVAELVGASAVRVSGALDALPEVPLGTVLAGPDPVVAPAVTAAPVGGGSTPRPRPTGGVASPRPSATPAPSATPGPLAPVTEPLQSVIDAVVSALPTPVQSLVPAPLRTPTSLLPPLPPLPPLLP